MSAQLIGIKAVLFDLDGTLVDTAPDLVAALNLALKEHGLEEQSLESMREHASHGSLALVKAAQPKLDEDTLSQLQQRLLHWYSEVNGKQASLFDGIGQLLDELIGRDIKVGVITNKPARYTRPLLDALGLTDKLSCIISGDTCTRRKPDVAPMYLGAMQSGTAVDAIAYLGDAERDLLAAKAAGMQGVTALWGYISATDDPGIWPAVLQLVSPLSLLDHLK